MRDRDHFDYLMKTYILKKHGGWRWTETAGWVAPKRKRGTREANLPTKHDSSHASSPARKGAVENDEREQTAPRAPLVINWDLDDDIINGLSVE